MSAAASICAPTAAAAATGKRPRLRPWLLLAATLCLACGRAPAQDAAANGSWGEIRGKRVELEIVRTPEAQRQGLSGRHSLAWGHGMYFPYPEARPLRFWMKDMHFDIDIVWIRDARVIEISHRVPHPEPGIPDALVPTVQPREVGDAVLEVPAGFASAHGWRRGDTVTISP